MMSSERSIPTWILRLIEWLFSIVAATICVGAVIIFASEQYPVRWPTPGLYFVEITFLAIVGLVSRLLDVESTHIDFGVITWVVGGVLLPFVILGVFSIGPFIAPAVLIFWLTAAVSDVRQNRALPIHIGFAAVAAVMQAALMGLMLL